MTKSIAEQCQRAGSQGGKEATCVRCGGKIPPYAGRAVSLLRDTYAHHPGQCQDSAERAVTLRQVAVQGTFAWECTHVEPGTTEPAICSAAGTERATYTDHMKTEHGKTTLKPTVPPIKLRKGAPAAARQAPRVAPFKRYTWTQTHQRMTDAGDSVNGPTWETAVTEHRGQFWANGLDANSVIVIEDMRAAGLPNRLVTLYLDGQGNLTADWSGAKYGRREANRVAKRNAA